MVVQKWISISVKFTVSFRNYEWRLNMNLDCSFSGIFLMFPKKINSFPPFISKTATFESGREGDAIMQGELQ